MLPCVPCLWMRCVASFMLLKAWRHEGAEHCNACVRGSRTRTHRIRALLGAWNGGHLRCAVLTMHARRPQHIRSASQLANYVICRPLEQICWSSSFQVITP